MEDTKYKRILLIVPPFYRLLGSRNNWMHLGLHYIGAVLNEHGYHIKIYNADADPTTEVTNYASFFEEDIEKSFESSSVWEEISKTIQTYAPDLVGITMTSVTRKMAHKVAEIVKRINQSTSVVVGGPHATLRPREPILDQNIDYLIRGEGEYALLKFVQGEDVSRISGFVWKENGKVQVNPPSEFIGNLDALPFPIPELELVQTNLEESFIVIQTTRGCPFNCFFCSSPRIWGRKVRRRSVENVIAEIEYRKKNYGVSQFYFCDDTFNTDPVYLRKLCDQIVTKKLGITFSCEARLNLVDRTTLELMKQAGCIRIKIGVESGNDRILCLMEKNITVRKIKDSVRQIKEANIPVTVYVMVGVPTETTSEMLDTLELCKELDPDWVSLSVATPWYGTRMYDMVADQLSTDLSDSFLFHQSKSVINENVTSEIISQFLELNKGKERETV